MITNTFLNLPLPAPFGYSVTDVLCAANGSNRHLRQVSGAGYRHFQSAGARVFCTLSKVPGVDAGAGAGTPALGTGAGAGWTRRLT